MDPVARESLKCSLGQGKHTKVICPKKTCHESLERTSLMHHNPIHANHASLTEEILTLQPHPRIINHPSSIMPMPLPHKSQKRCSSIRSSPVPDYLQAVKFNNSQSILGPINFFPFVHQSPIITKNSPKSITGV